MYLVVSCTYICTQQRPKGFRPNMLIKVIREVKLLVQLLSSIACSIFAVLRFIIIIPDDEEESSVEEGL